MNIGDDFRYWEKRGETYKDLDDVKSTRTAYKIVRVIKNMNLGRGAWILDGGCGRGDITRVVRDNIRHSNVIGVDLSKKMISGAKHKEKYGLKFFDKDFFKFADKFDNFFDLIYMSLFIHHLTDGNDQRALDEAYRAVKDNGYVLIAEALPPSENIFNYYSEIFRIKENRNCYLLQDLFKLIREAGFQTTHYITYKFDIKLKSWLNDNTLSEEKKKLLYLMHTEASSEFKKAYAMDPLPGGDYRLRCKMAVVTGRKS